MLEHTPPLPVATGMAGNEGNYYAALGGVSRGCSAALVSQCFLARITAVCIQYSYPSKCLLSSRSARGPVPVWSCAAIWRP